MKKELILKEIFRQNKFWEQEKQDFFFEFDKYKRKLFFLLLNYLNKKQILSIVGLRRTGKTVLLKQLIKYIIKNNKIDVKNILFLSFDEALVTDTLSLNDYLNAYLENIRANSKDRIYIFIDEIQYIDKWQHILKRYYDSEPNIKFIISGSSSLFLKKKATESLAGRIYEFKLNILDFLEYLELTGQDKVFINDYKRASLNIKKISLRKAKQEQINIENFLARHKTKAQKLFNHYLSYGQFPESALETDKDKAAKYLRESVYKKSIEYDIPRIFGVEKIGALKFVYEILMNETGNQIELQNIASETGLAFNTLSDYIEFFKESLLVDIVYNYSKSFRKSRRSAKKVYIASTNFYRLDESANLRIKNQISGHLAETYAFNFLKNNFEYIATYKNRNREIDFVCADNLQDSKNFYFVEVKYKEGIKDGKFRFLKSTAEKISGLPYLIFTKNDFYINEKGLAIPLYLWV